MPRSERELVRDGSALVEFAADLRLLRTKAATPSYRDMGRVAHYSATTLSEAANGRKLPSLAVTLAFVRACDGDEAEWEERWHATAAELNENSAMTSATEEPGGAPYVGLRAFGPDDQDLFFGRERLVAEVVGKRQRLVLLFGASGSGKSSVLRAGVIPALTAAGKRLLLFTPGTHPIERCSILLAAELGVTPAAVMDEWRDDRALHRLVSQLSADEETVLVVDQFEEVFTLCDSDAERARFIAALAVAANTPGSRCRVLLGVRSDFFAHCSAHPALVEAMPDGQVVAGPMSADELRQAIVAPASRMNCTVDGSLVADLLTQAHGRPGVLPLLSHVLLQVWTRRSGNRLSVTGFQQAGGLDGALSRTAEEVFTGLDEPRQRLARTLFGRLVALGEGTEDTKRRLDTSEVGDDPGLAAVLEAFTAARLLAKDQDGVEIAHEALIRAWPRLHGWLHDDRESIRLHRQLTDATDAWESLGRDNGALYRGARLALTLDWAGKHESALSPREQRFLDASRSAEITTGRRLRRLVALLSVVSLVAVAATSVAWYEQRRAADQRNAIRAQVVADEAPELHQSNPQLAVQLALAAHRTAPSTHTRDGLISTLPVAVVQQNSVIMSVALSPDGRTVATGSDDHVVRLWDITDPRSPKEVVTLTGHTEPVYTVAFSPDGRTLASAGFDHVVRLWDLADPRNPAQLTPLAGHTVNIHAVAFSPDSRTLASVGWDRTVRLWNVTDPRKATETAVIDGFRDVLYDATFSPDGRTLAVVGDEPGIWLYDITDAQRPARLAAVTGHDHGVYEAAFSPDGKILASVGEDRSARLWDVSDPTRLTSIAVLDVNGHDDSVYAVAFSPDGRTLATAGDDRTTRLWDVTDPRRVPAPVTVSGSLDAVEAVVFSADGHMVITGGWDAQLRLLDTDLDRTVAHACDTVRTVITEAEWDRYFPGLPYEPPCPGDS
ncbi:helix-turn-helix domain-containing protein [Lentzea sp. NPDC058450]|uniref:nSTAND1 domain-containing NTPase n=1 Tax=Lentzea sp. NPDC058450 TaxID=3346505 RepID=UPI003667797E